MNNNNCMTVTVKLNADETQKLCEIVRKIKYNVQDNKDEISFGITENQFILDIFGRIATAAKRKADKLETLGSEFRTSLEYGNLN